MHKPSNEKLQRIMLDSMLTEFELEDRKHGGINEGVIYGLRSAEWYKEYTEKYRAKEAARLADHCVDSLRYCVDSLRYLA